jgi:colanic acid/amylovoran biosynthesis glycosyltransferase
MRIAVIVNVFPALSETFIQNQVTGMIEAGHDVDVFTHASPQAGEDHPDVARYRLRERARLLLGPPAGGAARLAQGARLLLRTLPRQPGPLLRSLDVFHHGRKALSLQLLRLVASFARHGSYDLIHAHFGPNGELAVLLRGLGLHRGPIVVSFRGYDATRWVVEHGPGCYEGLFREDVLLMPVSRHLAGRLEKLGCPSEKIQIHHSGIKLEEFPFAEREPGAAETVRLLSVGRFVEKKGLEYGIRAVARVRSERPDRRIVYRIVGDGELAGDLKRLVDRLGLNDCVELLGSRSHREIPSLLRESHVFLLPSVRSAEGDEEGIPVSLMEAMATGLPVVSTVHGGIPELVEDGVSGFLAPERNAGMLARRIVDLVDHPEHWREMGRRGRMKVEAEHDSDALNERLEATYLRLLSGRCA